MSFKNVSCCSVNTHCQQPAACPVPPAVSCMLPLQSFTYHRCASIRLTHAAPYYIYKNINHYGTLNWSVRSKKQQTEQIYAQRNVLLQIIFLIFTLQYFWIMRYFMLLNRCKLKSLLFGNVPRRVLVVLYRSLGKIYRSCLKGSRI
jgi:hypothetical protein